MMMTSCTDFVNMLAAFVAFARKNNCFLICWWHRVSLLKQCPLQVMFWDAKSIVFINYWWLLVPIFETCLLRLSFMYVKPIVFNNYWWFIVSVLKTYPLRFVIFVCKINLFYELLMISCIDKNKYSACRFCT